MRPKWTTRALATGRIHLCEGCHGAFVPTWGSPFFCLPCERRIPPKEAFHAGFALILNDLCNPSSIPRLRRTFFSQLH